MPSISNILLSGDQTDVLVNRLAPLLESHVMEKSGLTGLAIKTGYSTLRAAKPDIAARAIRRLLPSLITAIEPLHASFQQSGAADFSTFLKPHAGQVAAETLLALGTAMANSPNKTAKTLYQRFEKTAHADLEKIAPTLGELLAEHAC